MWASFRIVPRPSWSTANSGKVLYAERATDPWFPASITKLMTAYVALSALPSPSSPAAPMGGAAGVGVGAWLERQREAFARLVLQAWDCMERGELAA